MDENIFLSGWIPMEFNIYGCEYSTDIDVGIIVPNPLVIEQYKQLKLKLNFNFINAELESLGYDLSKTSIDYNLLYIDSKSSNLSVCLLGCY